jgi:hypothetical protein
MSVAPPDLSASEFPVLVFAAFNHPDYPGARPSRPNDRVTVDAWIAIQIRSNEQETFETPFIGANNAD